MEWLLGNGASQLNIWEDLTAYEYAVVNDSDFDMLNTLSRYLDSDDIPTSLRKVSFYRNSNESFLVSPNVSEWYGDKHAGTEQRSENTLSIIIKVPTSASSHLFDYCKSISRKYV